MLLRKWLIPGAEYSIFTGQPLDPRDRKLDKQLEEALVHARKEEKEATCARRALEKELEQAQVSPSFPFLSHVGRHGHGACPFRECLSPA